jgi:CelD/BcsL family acetyltransferase involved in cellulose biosynthesis
MLARMTPSTVDTDAGCPSPAVAPPPSPAGEGTAGDDLLALRQSIDAIAPATWDGLAARTPWATPFSSWAYHRAWWDAYASSAHDQTVVIVDRARPETPIAIVPLMHRHQVEPTDAEMHTTIRHGRDPGLTAVSPRAKVVFFGASYHADYATVLADPREMGRIARATVGHLAQPTSDRDRPLPWDAVDLRRLRCGDPAADALRAAFSDRESELGWHLTVEREDVCPVVTLPEGADVDGYLATLDKKARHEIRRKVRRAEAAGTVELVDSTDAHSDLEAFIELHQKRWGAQGLFPATAGGAASRRFARRLFELFGNDGPLKLAFLTLDGRRIAAGIHFETDDGYLYYNAGIDPDARDLSPGVLMIERYVRRALAAGKRRLDFLRGGEPYKYEWGAVDEPIQRILVRCPGVS